MEKKTPLEEWRKHMEEDKEMHVRAETLPRDCKMWATHAQENDKVRTIRKKKKKKSIAH